MPASLDSVTPEFGRISPARPEWLARAEVETELDAGLPVVDTHFHVWENGTYTIDDYAADCAGHRITSSVYVECGNWYRRSGPDALRSIGETEAVVRLTQDRRDDTVHIGAIVPRVDLTTGSWVQPAIEGHLDAGGPLIGAFRDGGAYDPDPAIGNAFFVDAPGRYRTDEFASGMAVLATYGLPLEAWAFFTQLDEVHDLAVRFPETPIVLEHAGGPLGYGPYTGRGDEVFAAWDRAMTRIAACENVVVKLGGLMIRLAAFDYRSAARPATSEELAAVWSPYLHRALELFGPDRCMAESNFPVERAGAAFVGVLNALKRSISDGSPTERRAVLSATAMRVYGIEQSTASA